MTAHSATIASYSLFLDTTTRFADTDPLKESFARRWIIAMMAARQRQADKRLANYLQRVRRH
jgi:hypothetical protein